MKSDICYIVDGQVVAAKASALVLETKVYENGYVSSRYIPREELAALLPALAAERTRIKQKQLDGQNATWDAADAGDASAKHWTAFIKRPTTRTAEPCRPQEILVYDYQWRDGKAIEYCRHCGDMMFRINNGHRYTYCSNGCVDAAAAKREAEALANPRPSYYTPVVPTPTTCAVCGDAFTPKRTGAKTCSTRCRVKAHRQKQA